MMSRNQLDPETMDALGAIIVLCIFLAAIGGFIIGRVTA